MFLKITRTTNLFIIAAAIVQMPLILSSLIANVFRVIVLPEVFYSIAFYPIIILSLFLNYYLIGVLIFFKEKRFIIAAFVIYFCLHVLENIPLIALQPRTANSLAPILGILTLLVSIYLVIASVKISNPIIKFPFRLLSISLLIIGLTKIGFTVLYPFIYRDGDALENMIAIRRVIDYLNLFILVVPVSIIILATWINRDIAAKKIPPAENW